MLLSIFKERWNEFKHPSAVTSEDTHVLPVYDESNVDVQEETVTTIDLCFIALLGISIVAMVVCSIF